MECDEWINVDKFKADFIAKIQQQGHWPKTACKEVLAIFKRVLDFSPRIVPVKYIVNRKKYFIRNH